MKKIIILLILIIYNISYVKGQDIESLLNELDHTIKNRESYFNDKVGRIRQIESIYPLHNDEQNYAILGKIFDEFRAFNTDSCAYYAQKKMQLAKKIGKRSYIDDSNMNLAEVYGITGMYKEALDILNTVDRSKLAEYLVPYYYYLYRTIYGLMSDYSMLESDKKKYAELTDHYRDSLLIVNKKQTYAYVIVKADGLIYNNKANEAILLLSGYMNNLKKNDPSIGTLAYTMSLAYRKNHDNDKRKYYLAISSLSDIERGAKEYVSLRELAQILYDEGDLDRSYNYLKCSMEDAAFCNARLRTIEVSKFFPIVEKAYQQKLHKKEMQRTIALAIVSFLTILLMFALFFLYKQYKNLVRAREQLQNLAKGLQEMNIEQKLLNEKLVESNKQLRDSNNALIESNRIKEEYIGHYMNFCSLHIDKMENYRHLLCKIAQNEKVEALFKKLRSNQIIEDELKEFYENFDDTFLHLFPNFVDEFNELLVEDGREYPKSENQLTTVLRIFALIRLGITDSVKIAEFLRYSVTTIYNYRVKVRNKAIGDRNELEEKVMNISRITKK